MQCLLLQLLSYSMNPFFIVIILTSTQLQFGLFLFLPFYLVTCSVFYSTHLINGTCHFALLICVIKLVVKI